MLKFKLFDTEEYVDDKKVVKTQYTEIGVVFDTKNPNVFKVLLKRTPCQKKDKDFIEFLMCVPKDKEEDKQ